jgi:HD superfamily phosphohydrolase
LILSALRKNGATITRDEIQLYRLAGLLHDVGHYPFSHAMEDALGDHFDALLIEDASPNPEIGQAEHELGDQARWFPHERVGKEVLTVDEELCSILKRFDIAASNVYAIFTREKPPEFANLVSSDLDADRIDYLLRTAHHTGLPYGSVDIRYLLSQLRLDRDNRICLRPKALRAADHFLIGRYFDYPGSCT